MDDATLQDAISIVNQLRRLARSRQSAIDPLQGQGYVLYHLCHRGGTAQPGELSHELGITTPRMTTILTTLEKQGLIIRSSSPGDRRRVIVSLTPQGHALVCRHDEEQEHSFRQLFDALGQEDAQNLTRLLHKVLDHLKSRP